MSVQIIEATKVNAFKIEGKIGLFKKVSRAEASAYNKDCGKEDKTAVQALVGATISWFIPFEVNND